MNRKRKGFTLIEIIAVVIIIALIGSLGASALLKKSGQAKANIAIAQMSKLEGAIENFGIDCGRYPIESEGLDALIMGPSELEEKWAGPYLKAKQLFDPWDNPYIYIEEGQVNPGSYDIICFGADGVEGGEGDKADLYNDR